MTEIIEGKGTPPNADPIQAKPDEGAGAKGVPNADHAARRIARERDAARAEADALKTQLAEIENAKKSDQEKAIEAATKKARESTLAEMQAQMLQKDIRTEIRLKLAEVGVPANQAAVILEESQPATIEDAIAATESYSKRWKDEIVKPAPVLGIPGAPSVRGQSTLTLADVSKMSRAEYIARAVEIDEGIASGRIR